MTRLRLSVCRISLLLALAALLAAALAAGCSGGGSSSDEEVTPSPAAVNTPPPLIGGPTEADLPFKVLVTLPLFEDFVREVGRENAEVSSLLPAGADPHTYELSEEDLARVAEADFVFYNGGLDDHLVPAIEANAGEDTYVVDFASNVASPGGGIIDGRAESAVEAGDNPHLFLDPQLARVYAELVADEFNIYDGINEQFYGDNYNAYVARIAELDGEISADLQAIPQEDRVMVTYHDSFIHFANRYGFTIQGFAFEADGQDQARDAAGVEQLVRDSGSPALFAEQGFDTALMQEAATASGVELCTLESDILAQPGSTYFDMMARNVAEIVRCLGGG